MTDPNKPNEYPGQIRKAFVGTEPKAPGPAKPKSSPAKKEAQENK